MALTSSIIGQKSERNIPHVVSEPATTIVMPCWSGLNSLSSGCSFLTRRNLSARASRSLARPSALSQCCFLSVNCRWTIGYSGSRTLNQPCRLNHNRSGFLNVILSKIGIRENCAIISQGLLTQQNYLTYSHGANTSRTPPMMFSTSVPASRKPVLSPKVISDMTSAEKYPSNSMKLTTPSDPHSLQIWYATFPRRAQSFRPPKART
jgi:hypothetical protein